MYAEEAEKAAQRGYLNKVYKITKGTVWKSQPSTTCIE